MVIIYKWKVFIIYISDKINSQFAFVKSSLFGIPLNVRLKNYIE